MIAFKTFGQCPIEQRPAGVLLPLNYPWFIEWCEISQIKQFESKGYQVLSNEDYQNYIDNLSTELSAYEMSDKTNYFVENSTFAVDKDNVDQLVIGNNITTLISVRKLWDNNNEFSLDTHKFIPKHNGVWNANGTITFVAGLTVNAVKFHIYRNDEIYFTVWSDDHIVGGNKYVAVFSCDCDCYATSEHNFDLRIELLGTDAEAVISGSDEETAWGMSFVARLDGESPT